MDINHKIDKDELQALTQLLVQGIQERKGRKITLVDLSDIETSIAEEFIICQGTSTTQVAAIADSIRDYALEHGGVKPFNYDGYGASEWIVLDYGPIMVHVFMREVRDRYNIEDLWSDAPQTEIPDLD